MICRRDSVRTVYRDFLAYLREFMAAILLESYYALSNI